MSLSGMTIKSLSLISSLFTSQVDAGHYNERDVFCAVQNVWHEARGQKREEWIAITQVVLNRSKSGKFPKEICSVVRQLNQFSWTGDNLTDDIRPLNHVESMRLTGIVITVMSTLRGEYVDQTHGAIFYHEKTIKPYWAKNARGYKLGAHIFYAALSK